MGDRRDWRMNQVKHLYNEIVKGSGRCQGFLENRRWNRAQTDQIRQELETRKLSADLQKKRDELTNHLWYVEHPQHDVRNNIIVEEPYQKLFDEGMTMDIDESELFWRNL